MCDATSAQPTVTLREFAQHEYMGAPLTEMVHVLEDTGGLLKGDSFERKPQRIDSRPICVPAMGKFGELLAFLCVNKRKPPVQRRLTRCRYWHCLTPLIL